MRPLQKGIIMQRTVTLRRAILAIVIAGAGTTILNINYAKYLIAEAEAKNLLQRNRDFSETWERAWNDAKNHYNRHPHLYCDVCVSKMANPS